MARVTVEDCVDKVPNRFELVMLASHRAREISSGASLTIDRDNDKNPVVALREIAEETQQAEDLRERMIESHQTQIEVDEPEEDAMALLMGTAEADKPAILRRHHAEQHGDRQQRVGSREQHGRPRRLCLGVGVGIDDAQGPFLVGPDHEPNIEPHDQAQPHADANRGADTLIAQADIPSFTDPNFLTRSIEIAANITTTVVTDLFLATVVIGIIAVGFALLLEKQTP